MILDRKWSARTAVNGFQLEHIDENTAFFHVVIHHAIWHLLAILRDFSDVFCARRYILGIPVFQHLWAILYLFSLTIPLEIVPTESRAVVSSYFYYVWADVGSLILTFAFPVLETKIDGFSILVLLVLPMILIAIVLPMILPETHGRPVSEILQELREESAESYEPLNDSAARLRSYTWG